MSDVQKKFDDWMKKDRIVSEGGWALVKEPDLMELAVLIHLLIDHLWAEDPDGDLPVEFRLVDRTRFRQPYFRNMPYAHKDQLGYEDAVMSNLSAAVSEADTMLKLRRTK